MSAAADWLRTRARTYFEDSRRFGMVSPADALAVGGMDQGQWEIVYRTIAREMYDAAAQLDAFPDEQAEGDQPWTPAAELPTSLLGRIVSSEENRSFLTPEQERAYREELEARR